VAAIEEANLTPADLQGRTLTIRISNPTGACRACRQGLTSSAEPGVLKQLSLRYPGLTLKGLAEGGLAAPKHPILQIQNGKILQ
jgi:hypothetical protein